MPPTMSRSARLALHDLAKAMLPDEDIARRKKLDLILNHDNSIKNVIGGGSEAVYGIRDLAIATTVTWTNQPAGEAEFGGLSPGIWIPFDLRPYSQVRLVNGMATVGPSGCIIYVQWSVDTGGSWNTFTTASVDASISGYQESPWSAVDDAARTDVILRIAGWGGDGVADPVYRATRIQFR